ncbi:MAG TPA: ABC transporter substrate-binding protein, partial [Caldisericia bacterium]|nr:ABC transporter substrate-binding protein [Caldisericia bacterium]
MKRFSSIVALFVVALMAFAGCGTSTDDGTPTEQTRSGTLRVAIGQDAPTLDPARVTDTTSHEVTKQMYEGLVAYDKELNIVASLASSWDVSPD